MHGDQIAHCLLVADVGGTNTRIALSDGTELQIESICRYRNADHGSLEELIELYINERDEPGIHSAAVAVAGPVQDGRGELTNISWSIDLAALSRTTGAAKVAVLNDLQAQGYALARLDSSRLRTIVRGPGNPNSISCLVVGIGTGFNAAPVHQIKSGLLVPPSEAGHAGLPIGIEDDLDLWRFLDAAGGYPAVEDALSGRGLENIYRWKCQATGHTGQKTANEIMAAISEGNDPSAEEAVRVFVRLLGNVCGNLSLFHLPFGGVYLVGGVARAIAPHLADYGFADAFQGKGRFSEFMENFSVHVVEDDYLALLGLAAYLET